MTPPSGPSRPHSKRSGWPGPPPGKRRHGKTVQHEPNRSLPVRVGASVARQAGDGLAPTGVPYGLHCPGFVNHYRLVARGTGEVSPARAGGDPSA